MKRKSFAAPLRTGTQWIGTSLSSLSDSSVESSDPRLPKSSSEDSKEGVVQPHKKKKEIEKEEDWVKRHLITLEIIRSYHGKSAHLQLYQGSPDWLKWREGGIGSSLVGTICGVNGAAEKDEFKPYQTPLLGWRRFMGKVDKEPYNFHMKRGHDQEEDIGTKYKDVIGNERVKGQCYQHEHFLWAKVTNSRWSRGKGVPVTVRWSSEQSTPLPAPLPPFFPPLQSTTS